MISLLRLTRLLHSRQPVNQVLPRTRTTLKDHQFTTSAATYYAPKNYDYLTKEPKRKDKSVSTETLVPGSQQPIADEAAREEYAKTKSAMQTPVEWFRRECNEAESRANGRVTPAILKPVRVKMQGVDDTVGLEQIATVGVRDGTTLIVTVFDEGTTKAIEQAIYDAKIPHVVPQRYDKRTIKIPIPKPTIEARITEYTAQHRKAEDIRVQIRKTLQASIKRGGYGKRSVTQAEFHKLSDRYISEVDQILSNLKKATGAK